MLGGVGALEVFEVVDAPLVGVALRHFEQLGFVAALWHDKLHVGPSDLGHFGHNHLVVFHAERLANLLHGVGYEVGAALVEAALVAQRNRAHHRASAHVHVVDVDVALGAVAMHAEHVDFVDGLAHDHGAALIFLNQVILHFQVLSLLEAEFRR